MLRDLYIYKQVYKPADKTGNFTFTLITKEFLIARNRKNTRKSPETGESQSKIILKPVLENPRFKYSDISEPAGTNFEKGIGGITYQLR